jgi:hypothetical protein
MVTDIAAHLWQPDDGVRRKPDAVPDTPDFLGGNIEQEMLEYIQAQIWKPNAGPLNSTEDLFELGMDSSQAMQLHRFLIAQISKSRDPVSISNAVPKVFLYTHSSIAKITALPAW